jgi:Ca2+-transporting ATPase
MTGDRLNTPQPWHRLGVDEVLEHLGTSSSGLTSTDAAARAAVVGPNALPPPARRSIWAVLRAQFRSVVVALLLIATVLAWLAGEPADAVAIAVVLGINVALGFGIELRAHRAVEALSRLETPHTTAVRDGWPRVIDARDLVPGDVIALEAGQGVPADARVIGAVELRVNEATLTGESIPVSKHVHAIEETRQTLSERRNMVHAGTTVATGSGRAVVVATGSATELGHIGTLIRATGAEPTPLERKLNQLGRQLVLVGLIVGALTAVLAWSQNQEPAAIMQAAVALAVAAVPEGLPAVATIALALAVRRMAKRRALVRRLPSVETLGSVTVICTDKTGTLTAGAMTVTAVRTSRRLYGITGDGYAPHGTFVLQGEDVDPRADGDLISALRIAAVVNRGDAILTGREWVAHGDPTEAALVVAARKAGIERVAVLASEPEVGEIPFSSERKLMATFHAAPDTSAALPFVAYVKGAPHRVLELCTRVLRDAALVPLDAAAWREIMTANHDLSARGLRVLAVASGQVSRAEPSALVELTFAGLIGITDPPATGVRETIRAFHDAGIATVMVTGDQQGTARAIAHELGLLTSQPILDGGEIDQLSDDDLRTRVTHTAVFSRVSPQAKVRIVEAFRDRGEIVAMIGDGVNDAAALQRADVGVTMGTRGADVARETASVVLQDDRFQTIGAAIEEGRVVYENIRKFVFYLFSCNLAEILVLLGTGAGGLPLPLRPIQILWLNLVTDTLPALALALEPGEPDAMRRQPRSPSSAIVSDQFMRSIAVYAALIASSTFLAVMWTVASGVPPAKAMTMNFMTLALAQLLHLGNARDRRPVVRPERIVANPAAVVAVVGVLAVQVASVYVPWLASLLQLERLEWRDWVVILIASALPAIAGQALKSRRSRGPLMPEW